MLIIIRQTVLLRVMLGEVAPYLIAARSLHERAGGRTGERAGERASELNQVEIIKHHVSGLHLCARPPARRNASICMMRHVKQQTRDYETRDQD